jgi:hypothetical protein
MKHRVQVALTPDEAKWIIAKAIVALPEIALAREEGHILLKGGTTVSAVSEEFSGPPLRISGRVSARGAMASVSASPENPHCLLLENGRMRNVDEELPVVVKSLRPGDVVIIGANAIDAEGNAAMMAGAEGGGVPGEIWAAISTEGASVIIAAGLEKLIPGTISEATIAAGRKGVDKSVGMAVGLMPIYGRLITEKNALELLADVKVTVIGKGGVFGGEGSTVLAVEGTAEETDKIFRLVLELKGSGVSAVPDSVPECTGPNPRCSGHLGCVYKKGYRKEEQT